MISSIESITLGLHHGWLGVGQFTESERGAYHDIHFILNKYVPQCPNNDSQTPLPIELISWSLEEDLNRAIARTDEVSPLTFDARARA